MVAVLIDFLKKESLCKFLSNFKFKTNFKMLYEFMWFCGTTSISCILETILWPIYDKLFSVWFKEHCKLDKPTGVGDHCNATGHSVSMDNLKVLDKEQRPGLPAATHLWSDHFATTIWAEAHPPPPRMIIAWSRSCEGRSKRRNVSQSFQSE